MSVVVSDLHVKDSSFLREILFGTVSDFGKVQATPRLKKSSTRRITNLAN